MRRVRRDRRAHPRATPQEPRRSENGPAADGSGGESKHLNVHIDFAGIEDRVVAFPVEEARYRQIVGTPSRVLFTSVPVEGSLHLSWPSSGPPEASGRVDAYEFDENKVERIFDVCHVNHDLGKRQDTRVAGRQSSASGVRLGEEGGDAAHAERDEIEAGPKVRLGRPRSVARLRRTGSRVAADVPRVVATPARPVLDARHVGRGLGRDPRSLSHPPRPGGEPSRVLRSRLGNAGRAWHVALLRNRR